MSLFRQRRMKRNYLGKRWERSISGRENNKGSEKKEPRKELSKSKELWEHPKEQ